MHICQIEPTSPDVLFTDMPVCVIDDCKEHVEQNEEAAEDVENEEPGTLSICIKLKFRLTSCTNTIIEIIEMDKSNLPTGVALYIALKSKSPSSDLTKVYLHFSI